MLDTDTKRRIDTARDILVGKVPDPKSQVEQITIALIYKFMDDMDSQVEELGGKRKFFTGDFAKYGWAKLMAPSVSGEERIALYGEGMVKMTQNPNIPRLFRDIFKNAYLPYRDPETLKAFLKTINGFEYDHSERLGDAFEYLLSVLGSQGDAGQFRTPRHIIDFIVAVLDPKKTDTVLDPACGTAGFLISAHKHILAASQSPDPALAFPATRNPQPAFHSPLSTLNSPLSTHPSPITRPSSLTPDDRDRLARNFRGYDISPDMVRLSLMNMYLHGFSDPHIFEYDTLTSQDRWNEMADVILANPPFMSPKGGGAIQPHNRFSVQSKRSEVLFVDYIAEHLTPAGRAGIIVPEGVIFQSQTAYKALRKMLVDNYLVAVVSLPAGCFNPYSGVKTSILILDKSLAKTATTIAFFKVENDGFGLGAQRRAIDKNDLPQIQAELTSYLQSLRAIGIPADASAQLPAAAPFLPSTPSTKSTPSTLLPRAQSPEPRARSLTPSTSSTLLPGVPSPEPAPPSRPSTPSTKSTPSTSSTSSTLLREVPSPEPAPPSLPSTPSTRSTPSTSSTLLPEAPSPEPAPSSLPSTTSTKSTPSTLLPRAQSPEPRARSLTPSTSSTLLPEAPIPEPAPPSLPSTPSTKSTPSTSSTLLPRAQSPEPGARSLIVSKEKIAANGDYNLSGERYREGAARATRYPIVQLGEVAQVIAGQSPPGESYNEVGVGVPFYQGKTEFTEMLLGAPTTWTSDPQRFAERGDILISVRAPVGPVNLATQRICIGRGLAAIQPSEDKLLSLYAFYFLRSQEEHIKGDAGAVFSSINRGDIEKLKIPLPPLDMQQQIVAEIEGYQKVINGARAVLDNYRPHIPIHPDWPMVVLGDICSVGGTITTDVDMSLPYFGADSIESNTGKLLKTETALTQRVNGPVYGFAGQRLLYSKIRPYLNKLAVVDLTAYCSSDMYPLVADGSKVLITYLATYMLSAAFNQRIRGYYERASIPKINRSQLFETEIPLPSLAEQHSIVAEIEAEQALVAANRELIERFEKKIQATLARVWGAENPRIV